MTLCYCGSPPREHGRQSRHEQETYNARNFTSLRQPTAAVLRCAAGNVGSRQSNCEEVRNRTRSRKFQARLEVERRCSRRARLTSCPLERGQGLLTGEPGRALENPRPPCGAPIKPKPGALRQQGAADCKCSPSR